MNYAIDREILEKHLGLQKAEELWSEAIIYLHDNEEEYHLNWSKLPHDIEICRNPSTILGIYLETLVSYFSPRSDGNFDDYYSELMEEILLEAGILSKYKTTKSISLSEVGTTAHIQVFGKSSQKLLASSKYLDGLTEIEEFEVN